MTFRNINSGRVFRAVIIITAIASFLSFGGCYCFLVTDVMNDIDANADMQSQQDVIQERVTDTVEAIYYEGKIPSGLNTIFIVLFALIVALAFWQTFWAAAVAETPEQAMGYAVAVLSGVLLTFGGLLLIFGPVSIVLKGIFYMALVAASLLAGRMAGTRIDPNAPRPAPQAGGGLFESFFGGPRTPRTPPPTAPAQPRPGMAPGGPSAEVYYNMGVSAALGGRREEARQHFTRVIEQAPRHVPAWLQLANLADTPEQAWAYIQQARSINPNDPAVVHAVDVIWPQVAAKRGSGTPGTPPAPAPDVMTPGATDAQPAPDDDQPAPPTGPGDPPLQS